MKKSPEKTISLAAVAEAIRHKPMPTVAELLGADYTEAMQAAFPDVTPHYKPFGYNALIQLRCAPKKSKGGIILTDDDQDRELVRTQAGLVRCLAAACFRDRQTGEPWVEGAWYEPGDFVRCSMYGGDRWRQTVVADDGTKTEVLFSFFKDSDISGLVDGDPLTLKNS